MEDSQKESPHSSLQLGEFEGTFYKFYEILIFCVTVLLVSCCYCVWCLIIVFNFKFDFKKYEFFYYCVFNLSHVLNEEYYEHADLLFSQL